MFGDSGDVGIGVVERCVERCRFVYIDHRDDGSSRPESIVFS
jgi:hypothetical protein